MIKRHQKYWILFILLVQMSSSLAITKPPYEGQKRIRNLIQKAEQSNSPKEIERELVEVLIDKRTSEEGRYEIAKALGSLGVPDAEDLMNRIAQDQSESVKIRGEAFLSWWKIAYSRQLQENKVAFLEDGLQAMLYGVGDGGVRDWAANELADMGLMEALPLIEKSIQQISGDTKDARDRINVIKLKIELINDSTIGSELFEKVLQSKEMDRRLRIWAIGRLARLSTEDAVMVLVRYALAQENQFYIVDVNGRLKERSTKIIWDDFMPSMNEYKTIIHLLTEGGMTLNQMRQRGLHPSEAFLLN